MSGQQSHFTLDNFVYHFHFFTTSCITFNLN